MFRSDDYRSRARAIRVRLIRVLFACSLLCGFGARAQQAFTSATLTGRVEDANGAALSGAQVTAKNLDTSQSQSATSDGEGRYRFAYLPVGSYQLSVARAGFAPLEERITLTVGQSLDVPLRLSVAGLSESVAVVNESSIVEMVRTQVAETVSPREIDALPLNGRNYLDLALLVPGTSRTNTGSNQRFAETAAVPGQGISVAGQRNLNNGFIVDGLSANDDAADLAGTFYSEEVIREFQVVTSGGVAEFGRASSGFVNVITRSGTNALRGRLYSYLRNQRFDARNPLAPEKDPLTQGQYGATLGGPLRRDRTFFFANFEQTRRHDSNVITISPANVLAINNRLNAVGYRGAQLETGIAPGGYDSTNIFARIDHNFSQAHQLAARYSIYDITATNSRNIGGLNAVSRATALDDRDQTVAVNDTTTISPRVVNEARFQFTRSRLDAPVNDTAGPAVNISGVANFGTATSSPLARDITLFESSDSISVGDGAHSFKFGGDFLYNRVNILFPGATQGVYNFSSLANFLAGNYTSFQQAFGAASQAQSNPNVGAFVEDEWRARGDLTINAGVRYDAQFLPAPIRTDANNFAPRLGVAYAPGDRRTVLRASFGIYFDRIPLRATSNALQRDGSRYVVAQLAPTDAGAPTFPNVLASLPTSLPTRPNITRIDANIKASYSEQASAQVERQLTQRASISVGYLHTRGLHIILSRNVNVPVLSAAQARALGVANLGRPDATWGNISRYESSGDSYFDGMIVSFNERARDWATLRVAYTLSKTIDDAGNFFFSAPQDNFNLRGERGLSDNDQRHRLTVSGTLDAPTFKSGDGLHRALAGFRLSYLLSYASALPFNVVTGGQTIQTTAARPAGLGRNTGRGFDFASLDLRASRRFALSERLRVEVIAEGFNLLNRANYQIPNNVFGAGTSPVASFGRPTAAADPRQIQFGLRLDF